MPISQKFLINYLEHFNVSELKQINKYFNQRVSKQNGGGSLNKQELIWNLVGGASNRIPPFTKKQIISAVRRQTGAEYLNFRKEMEESLKKDNVNMNDLCKIVTRHRLDPKNFHLIC